MWTKNILDRGNSFKDLSRDEFGEFKKQPECQDGGEQGCDGGYGQERVAEMWAEAWGTAL